METPSKYDAQRADLIAQQAWIDCLRDNGDLSYKEHKRRARIIADEWRELKDQEQQAKIKHWRHEIENTGEQLSMF